MSESMLDNHRHAMAVCAACLIATTLAAAHVAHAQPAPPPAATTAPTGLDTDIAFGRRLLADVRDNVFSFDDPAFYWFCRYVRNSGRMPNANPSEVGELTAWRFLLERPGDYRGRRVVIEGILQARYTYEVPNRPGLGTLYQCELSELGTRALCAVVTTEDPADVPIRSRVRAEGYFIKVRAYRTSVGETGAGPLLVARGLTVIHAASEGPLPSGAQHRDTSIWVLIGTAALAILWLVLRRATRSSPTRTRRFPRSSKSDDPPSEDEFEWLNQVPARDDMRDE